MKKLLFTTIAIVLVSLLYESCKKELPPEEVQEEVSEDIDPNEVRINPKAIIVSEVANNNLVSISEGEIKFTANQSSEELEAVEVGSFLVSGIHNNAPVGYLRKVVGVQKSNDYTFITEDASLTDVVDQGFLEGEYTYSDNFSNHVSFALNEVLYDADNNNSTTNDQVKLIGSLDLIPTLYLEADWRFPNNLDRIKVGYNMEKITNLQLIGQSTLPNNYNVEKLILEKPLPPIQFLIGNLPVVVTSNVTLKAGINANGSVSFNVDYNENSQVSSYIEKPKGVGLNDFGNWISSTSKTQTSNIDENSLINYHLNFNGELPYVKADLNFYLYNSSNAKTSLGATASLEVDAYCNSSSNCDFDIDLKLKGCFDVDLEVMNFTLINNTFCPYVSSFDLYETAPSGGSASGCTDPDSPDYSFSATTDDGSCRYAYLNRVDIIDYNPQNDGSNWDAGTGATVNPDIIARIKKTSGTDWLVESTVISNCTSASLPFTYNVQPIKLTDESWTIEFLDEDLYFDDQMGITTFNPVDIIRVNNVSYIDVSTGGNTVRLYFTLQ